MDSGRVKIGSANKLNQIQKFVEVLNNFLISKFDETSNILIVDMGCGMGYLTFAIHKYLSSKYSVSTFGVEQREDIVEKTNAVAKKLDGVFKSLKFVTGNINSFNFSYDYGTDLIHNSLSNQTATSLTKIMVALHACDTATDDAIWNGIQNQFQLILVSPCCQKQLRRQIDRSYSRMKSTMYLTETLHADIALSSILSSGVYRDAINEIVTDKIRFLCLQIAGYECKVEEYVDAEFTAKNSLLSGSKSDFKDPINDRITELQIPKTKKWLNSVAELRSIIKTFGITQHRLIDLMLMDIKLNLIHILDIPEYHPIHDKQPFRDLNQIDRV
jgi:SAM-dependent methyltransferase